MDAVVWEQIKTEIRKQLPDHTYKMWIESISFKAYFDNTLQLLCVNSFSKKRIEEHFGSLIENEAKKEAGQSVRIQLQTDVQPSNYLIEPTDQQQVREVHEAMILPPLEPIDNAKWCGLPTDMTRCSPFFPMNTKTLGKRPYLDGLLIASGGWGEIKYFGPKLSVFDEDMLLALLFALDGASLHKRMVEFEGHKTFAYEGPFLPLLRVLGIKRPGKTNYNRCYSSLRRMMSAVLELSISTGKTKVGKKRAPRKFYLSNMLSNVFWNEEKKILSATVNPFFYEMHIAGNITFMNVAKRFGMKGTFSKALYRFVQSHRDNSVFAGHFLTLADALNMEKDQAPKEIRRKLKMAIDELIRQGILSKKSRFVKQNIVSLERVSEALPEVQRKKNE